MIGNAVTVVLAEALAFQIKKDTFLPFCRSVDLEGDVFAAWRAAHPM
jgi:hypothetical protein